MAIVPPFIPVTPDALGETNLPKWASNFFRTYNIFGTAVSNAVNGGLINNQNFVGVQYPASGYSTITTGPKYTSGQFTPYSFPWGKSQYKTPSEVRIGIFQPVNGAINTSPLSITSWSYSATTDAITINYIAGLANSTAYYFTFIAQ